MLMFCNWTVSWQKEKTGEGTYTMSLRQPCSRARCPLTSCHLAVVGSHCACTCLWAHSLVEGGLGEVAPIPKVRVAESVDVAATTWTDGGGMFRKRERQGDEKAVKERQNGNEVQRNGNEVQGQKGSLHERGGQS